MRNIIGVIGTADRRKHPPWDLRTSPGSQPERELEDEEAKDGDSTITVRCSLLHEEGHQKYRHTTLSHHAEAAHLSGLETESRAENDTEKSQPAETKLSVPRQTVERLGDEGPPDGTNRLAHDRVWNEPESNDPGKLNGNVTVNSSRDERRFHTTVGKNFLYRYSQDKSPSPESLHDPRERERREWGGR